LNTLFGDRFVAFSAGTHPSVVHGFAREVMEKIGIDMSKHRSKSIDEFTEKKIDIVYTLCDSAKETCPYFPGGAIRKHRSFQDPTQGGAGGNMSLFREVRSEIKRWICTEFS